MSGELRIGTAGWGVPTRYLDDIPPGGSHLERYARHFTAAEINSSFHRPHQFKVYQRWAQATPQDFRFSVKIPKTMTHERRLAGCAALLDVFAAQVAGLGDRLGALLVQLPPSLAFDAEIAASFFADLQSRIAAPVALEPRHASWFASDSETWLSERRIARVAADPARVAGAEATGGWDGLAYYRWHGSPRVYFSSYNGAALQSLHRQLDRSLARGVPSWCIFDNTASGAALGDALRLEAMRRENRAARKPRAP